MVTKDINGAHTFILTHYFYTKLMSKKIKFGQYYSEEVNLGYIFLQYIPISEPLLYLVNTGMQQSRRRNTSMNEVNLGLLF